MPGVIHTVDWEDFGTEKYKIIVPLTNLPNIEFQTTCIVIVLT